jgi:hypothetical protein
LFNLLELYHLAEGVSEDDTSLIFNNLVQKVIKHAIKPTNEYQTDERLSPRYVVPVKDWLVEDAKAWDSLCE